MFGVPGASPSGDNELHLVVPNLAQPALSYLSPSLSLVQYKEDIHCLLGTAAPVQFQDTNFLETATSTQRNRTDGRTLITATNPRPLHTNTMLRACRYFISQANEIRTGLEISRSIMGYPQMLETSRNFLDVCLFCSLPSQYKKRFRTEDACMMLDIVSLSKKVSSSDLTLNLSAQETSALLFP